MYVRRLHLGAITYHTVFEGEVCGAILGLDIARECPRIRNVCILIDNQAAIHTLARGGRQPGRYLLDIFHRELDALLRSKPHLSFQIEWCLGHEGVDGNETVDGEAK
ncbi:hypothetical protein B0H10DRAFT_1775098, partial [Mycena sp. CBHHK59/15]